MREAVETFLRERTPGARIPFKTSDVLPEVMTGFRELLDLPHDVRDRWAITDAGDDKPDDGLVVREGGSHDFKAFFHFRPRLLKLLRHAGVRINKRQLDWIAACRELHTRCTACGVEVAGWLDAYFAGLSGGHAPRFQAQARAMTQHPLRLLSYDLRPGTIAQAHVDQSLLTLHLWDNYPGLRLWGEPITPVPDECVAFSGAKAELLSREFGPALPRIVAATHDVVQDPSATGRREAAVFFLHVPMMLPPGYVTKR